MTTAYLASAIALRSVRIAFDVVMMDSGALVDPASYTVADLNGSPIGVSSVSKATATSPRAVILHLASDLTTTFTYEVTVGGAVVTATSQAVIPATRTFEWIATPSSFTFPIPISGEESDDDFFGNCRGLVFFSPALTYSAANSIIL